MLTDRRTDRQTDGQTSSIHKPELLLQSGQKLTISSFILNEGFSKLTDKRWNLDKTKSEFLFFLLSKWESIQPTIFEPSIKMTTISTIQPSLVSNTFSFYKKFAPTLDLYYTYQYFKHIIVGNQTLLSCRDTSTQAKDSYKYKVLLEQLNTESQKLACLMQIIMKTSVILNLLSQMGSVILVMQNYSSTTTYHTFKISNGIIMLDRCHTQSVDFHILGNVDLLMLGNLLFFTGIYTGTLYHTHHNFQEFDFNSLKTKDSVHI